jgi:hypothetical protein
VAAALAAAWAVGLAAYLFAFAAGSDCKGSWCGLGAGVVLAPQLLLVAGLAQGGLVYGLVRGSRTAVVLQVLLSLACVGSLLALGVDDLLQPMGWPLAAAIALLLAPALLLLLPGNLRAAFRPLQPGA